MAACNTMFRNARYYVYQARYLDKFYWQERKRFGVKCGYMISIKFQRDGYRRSFNLMRKFVDTVDMPRF